MNVLIQSKSEWLKLKRLNEMLINEEKNCFQVYRFLENQAKKMLKNNQIQDYEIEVKTGLIMKTSYNNPNVKLEEDNYFELTTCDFMMFQGENKKYSLFDFHKLYYKPKHSKEEVLNQCYTFHDLYDHHGFTPDDLFKIETLFMDVNIDYQRVFNLNAKSE